MSKVKDILGVVVRSITKRILGTNVPPMPKADGTLLFHLKRIKDGVKAAYDALEKKQLSPINGHKDVDNLRLNIENATIPYIKVILNDGSEMLVSSLGDIALSGGVASKVIEIYDNATTFQTLNKPWGNTDNKSIKTLFPNVSKITFTKKENISRDYKDIQGNGYYNSAMIPSNTFKIVTHYMLSTKSLRSANYFIFNDTTIEEVHLPYFISEVNISPTFIRNASALRLIDMPNCVLCGVIRDCASLEAINLPKNKSTDRPESILTNCSSLKHISFPECTTLGGAYNGNKKLLTNCPLVEDIVLGKITVLSYINGISNISLDYLNKFEVGEGTENVCKLNAWTATNVEDDLLNSNFKTYFAERLATWTDGSVHTLTFCQSFYDRLTEENKTILANKGWTIAIAELE